MRTVTVPGDRRGSSRQMTISNSIRLSWPGPGSMLRAKGTLLNASSTGALAECEVVPPVDQWLIVRMRLPIRTDWYPARVVRHGESNQFGLRFARQDPYAFILAATIGIDMEQALIDLPDEQRFSVSGD